MPFCNVVEFSNFVVKLLSVFLHIIGPLTKKVAFHCSQLTLSLVNFVPIKWSGSSSRTVINLISCNIY